MSSIQKNRLLDSSLIFTSFQKQFSFSKAREMPCSSSLALRKKAWIIFGFLLLFLFLVHSRPFSDGMENMIQKGVITQTSVFLSLQVLINQPWIRAFNLPVGYQPGFHTSYKDRWSIRVGIKGVSIDLSGFQENIHFLFINISLSYFKASSGRQSHKTSQGILPWLLLVMTDTKMFF